MEETQIPNSTKSSFFMFQSSFMDFILRTLTFLGDPNNVKNIAPDSYCTSKHQIPDEVSNETQLRFLYTYRGSFLPSKGVDVFSWKPSQAARQGKNGVWLRYFYPKNSTSTLVRTVFWLTDQQSEWNIVSYHHKGVDSYAVDFANLFVPAGLDLFRLISTIGVLLSPKEQSILSKMSFYLKQHEKEKPNTPFCLNKYLASHTEITDNDLSRTPFPLGPIDSSYGAEETMEVGKIPNNKQLNDDVAKEKPKKKNSSKGSPSNTTTTTTTTNTNSISSPKKSISTSSSSSSSNTPNTNNNYYNNNNINNEIDQSMQQDSTNEIHSFHSKDSATNIPQTIPTTTTTTTTITSNNNNNKRKASIVDSISNPNSPMEISETSTPPDSPVFRQPIKDSRMQNLLSVFSQYRQATTNTSTLTPEAFEMYMFSNPGDVCVCGSTSSTSATCFCHRNWELFQKGERQSELDAMGNQNVCVIFKKQNQALQPSEEDKDTNSNAAKE